VLHEWWGLDGQIRDVARQFASQGYVAVVPDLYHGSVTSDPESARALMQKLEANDAFATIDEAARWLRAEPRTAKARLGIVGFCMGGGLAERYALRTSDLSAVVMFYGQPESDPAKLAGLHAPLQGHFGSEDSTIPLAKVEELRSALARAGKPGEVYTYPGAGHAFMHEGSDHYRPDAARQAWARMLAFLQEQLKAR
jgi:carboxymethylenebutenolidase